VVFLVLPIESWDDNDDSCAADPDTESRIKGDFYVPSDERFDYRKRSDNEADLLRSKLHAAGTVIADQVFKKSTFKSLDEIQKLYAREGESKSNGTSPGNVDDAAKAAAIRGGSRFLTELTAERTDGKQAETLKFPIPLGLKGGA